ncbi:protein-tyrosine-phosphatase [Roseivirga sp. BDSF3-8]|uniref:arsenate reductase/protein-tyrosine-phosphatase family protein n=1 Tax=Roseivirga sp. BDSF3-8 TaxID=3241598 RepID=UPI003531A2E2
MKYSLSVIAVLMALCMWSCSSGDSKEKMSTRADDKQSSSEMRMYPPLEKYIGEITGDFDSISAERKNLLTEVSDYIRSKRKEGEAARLTFICTHNSRRSHMSQIWAATAARHYGIDNIITTFSGGTEATAFNPRAVAAMQRAGFTINNPGGENPPYEVTFSENGPEMICFSKKYDDMANPSSGFMAVMTCSDADENCPIIPGAEKRVPVTYEDPKAFDGTDREAIAYDERCRQIATEMFYVMSQV